MQASILERKKSIVVARLYVSRGVATGGISVYIPSQNQSLKIIFALIAADVVRLLVYRTVVPCSKKLYPPKMNFWLRPCMCHTCHALYEFHMKQNSEWYKVKVNTDIKPAADTVDGR